MHMLRKIQSQRGASILLALAVVLVCTMVAAIVLAAAGANAGKGLSSQAQVRSYYSVSSAAQLLADDLENNAPKGKISTTVKHYTCLDTHPSYAHADEGIAPDKTIQFDENPTTPLAKIVIEGLNAIDPADESSSYERIFVIQAPELDEVNAVLTMDYRYNIKIELSAAPTNESFGYGLTMSIPSIQGEPKEEVSRIEEGDSHWDGWEWEAGGSEYSWLEENKTPINPSTGNHEPASNEYGHSTKQFYEVVSTTTTTQFAWGQATYEKGAGE